MGNFKQYYIVQCMSIGTLHAGKADDVEDHKLKEPSRDFSSGLGILTLGNYYPHYFLNTN